MSGHVLKKLLNDEGEFTKREIVNGKKKAIHWTAKQK